MTTETVQSSPVTDERRGVVRAAGTMAAGGIVFMLPVIGSAGIHANFEDDAALRLAGLEANWTSYLVGSALLSLGWLLMGIGMFLLCRRLGELETGRSGSVLRTVGAVMLVPFLVLTVAYIVPQAWSMTPAEWAAQTELAEPTWMVVGQATVVAVILVGWVTASTILARSEHWPTWLGVTFGVLGVLTMVVQLPLFAAIGAIVLGVTVRRRARAGRVVVAAPGSS